MVINFQISSKEHANLDRVYKIVSSKIKQIKKSNKNCRIGYVAGKITSDGPTQIKTNLSRLHRFTKKVSQKENIFVFSAADIFNSVAYWKTNLPKPDHKKQFYEYWGEILDSGITDIYMTPGWEKSLGATDEYNRMRKRGISIHFL